MSKKKKKKLKQLNTRNINEKLNRKEVLNNHLKSKDKELRHELAQNLENLQEKATRLQKYIAKHGTLNNAYLLCKSCFVKK